MLRDQEAVEFLTELGRRVRTARARRGMSRKAVSALSGVSPRYIAQLENGKGNISVVLLRQIGHAIGVPLEALIAGQPKIPAESTAIVRALQDASPGDVARVKALLGIGGGDARAERFVLIGLRGAGKSTLGRLAAGDLGLPFVELNAEIERQSGLDVAEIFALYGQEGYRRLEHTSLERIARDHDRVVLAVAGGIVSEPETFELLMQRFNAIWLRTSPKEHMARVLAQGDKRPMAGNPEAMAELEEILTSREALYARAPMTVGTSGRTIEESRTDLTAAIRRFRRAAIGRDGEGGAAPTALKSGAPSGKGVA